MFFIYLFPQKGTLTDAGDGDGGDLFVKVTFKKLKCF